MAKVCEVVWGGVVFVWFGFFLNETSNTRETALCVIKKQY